MLRRSTTARPGESELFIGQLITRQPFRTVRAPGLPTWLLIYNCRGEAFFRCDGQELRTQPGDAVLWSPPHARDYGSRRTGVYRRYYAEFHPRPEWHDWLHWPEFAPGLRHLRIETAESRRHIDRAFAEGIALGLSHHPRAEQFALNALERVLLWCEAEGRSAGTDPRIGRALDFLTQHFAEPVTLPQVARHCGLSVSRLSFLFHAATGTSPLRYLEQRRLDRARQLLRLTQHSVQSIAAEVGFPDPFYFSLRFKRHAGLSPRAFRQQSHRPAPARC